ncbi:MAG TPA: hypothetical protein PKE40_08180 [Arachnia sp.]|nr:hypothetical protein [Arachnia sp.]HMT86313.1 hypothetical protein [Arachnia sp.]
MTPGASLLLRAIVVGLAGVVVAVLLLGAACPWFVSLVDPHRDGGPPFERIVPVAPDVLGGTDR